MKTLIVYNVPESDKETLGERKDEDSAWVKHRN